MDQDADAGIHASCLNSLLKNGHLLRLPHPSSLRRTDKYASLLRISGALHLALFEQTGEYDFFNILLEELKTDTESTNHLVKQRSVR